MNCVSIDPAEIDHVRLHDGTIEVFTKARCRIAITSNPEGLADIFQQIVEHQKTGTRFIMGVDDDDASSTLTRTFL
jgi:hypothetical protein